MNGKILFVDDEPEVLKGYKRILRGDFQLSTALSGEDALAEIGKKGLYEVVVSDMKMPGMNGIQLLSQVRAVAPQTIRVVLTGHADIETAMTAVNEGAVFRFLTKPCPAGVLKKTLTACLMQYQLVTAGKHPHGCHQGIDRRAQPCESGRVRPFRANQPLRPAHGSGTATRDALEVRGRRHALAVGLYY